MRFLPPHQHKRWHLWRLVIYFVPLCFQFMSLIFWVQILFKMFTFKMRCIQFFWFFFSEISRGFIEVYLFLYTFENWYSYLKNLHFFVCLAGPSCEGTEESRGTISRSHAAFCSARTSQTSIRWSCTIVRFSLCFFFRYQNPHIHSSLWFLTLFLYVNNYTAAIGQCCATLKAIS